MEKARTSWRAVSRSVPPSSAAAASPSVRVRRADLLDQVEQLLALLADQGLAEQVAEPADVGAQRGAGVWSGGRRCSQVRLCSVNGRVLAEARHQGFVRSGRLRACLTSGALFGHVGGPRCPTGLPRIEAARDPGCGDQGALLPRFPAPLPYLRRRRLRIRSHKKKGQPSPTRDPMTASPDVVNDTPKGPSGRPRAPTPRSAASSKRSIEQITLLLFIVVPFWRCSRRSRWPGAGG